MNPANPAGLRAGYGSWSVGATVEFENGALAFLNENTVIEFYELSLDNGMRSYEASSFARANGSFL